jgi:hypothetical protein
VQGALELACIAALQKAERQHSEAADDDSDELYTPLVRAGDL